LLIEGLPIYADEDWLKRQTRRLRSRGPNVGDPRCVAGCRPVRPAPASAALEWIKAARIVVGLIFRSLPPGGHVNGGLKADGLGRIVKKRVKIKQIGKAPARFSGHSMRSGRIARELARGTGVRKLMTIARLRSADSVLSKAMPA
jgi:hypothetical protein